MNKMVSTKRLVGLNEINRNNNRILADQYKVPKLDILLTGINLKGVNYKPAELEKGKTGEQADLTRGRFNFYPAQYDKPFFMAVSIGESSPFVHNGRELLLNDTVLGPAEPPENDTCDDTYFRKGNKALTLNSNLKSTCSGCKFCGAYKLDEIKQKDLTIRENLIGRINELMKEANQPDMSFLESVGVVTGCFKDEDATLKHLMMIRETFKEYGFKGELRYIGSEIKSKRALELLRSGGPFGLYLTVECFDRRESMMKPSKASLSLDEGRTLLKTAKDLDIATLFLYILGLDPIEKIKEEMPKYLEVLTRHPIINLMQSYVPSQEQLRTPEATNLNYYLEARQEIERIMKPTGLRPMLWENYRSPWSTAYGDEPL